MISTQAREDAQLLWDFQQMHHELRPCSVAVGLGSHDLGVADTAVELYRRGLMPVVVFTGATSPTTRERMPRGRLSTTESVHWSWAFPTQRSSSNLAPATRGEHPLLAGADRRG